MKRLKRDTTDSSIERRAKGVALPSDLGQPSRIRRGLASYAGMCAQCHGAPGRQPGPLGLGLNPSPPRLHEAEGELLEPRRAFWVMKHGIRMTGMPAFGRTHEDQALWDIAAFLQELPQLSAGETTGACRRWRVGSTGTMGDEPARS